jgi:hypothetical protein
MPFNLRFGIIREVIEDDGETGKIYTYADEVVGIFLTFV